MHAPQAKTELNSELLQSTVNQIISKLVKIETYKIDKKFTLHNLCSFDDVKVMVPYLTVCTRVLNFYWANQGTMSQSESS